jgi:hypothetical protein
MPVATLLEVPNTRLRADLVDSKGITLACLLPVDVYVDIEAVGLIILNASACRLACPGCIATPSIRKYKMF